MIGERLDGWKLTKKLGEGGTGETYLAEREETGEKAAAKVLFAQASADRALLEKLFADTNAASQVNHVGMVDVYACGVHTDGRAYLVMELLEGKTLTDALIELGAVTDIESFADIAWQLATLLGAAHGAKLVHGALKPDGMFLTFPPAQAPRPLIKVLDFGMAKFSTSVRHSQTGSLLGAPLYMAPEIGRGLGNVDHRADIYSLGCILFEMLCGRPPFVREGMGELIIAHTTEAPPPVSSLEPSVPQAIDNLVGRMLTKNPAVRPQTMAEVAAVLEKFFKCPAPGASVSAMAPPSGPGAATAPATPLPQPGPALSPAQPTPKPGPAPSARFALPASFSPTPSSVTAEGVVVVARPAPAAPSTPRRQDSTALLPPDSGVAAPGPIAAPNQTWVARVRQRTAILEPPSQRHAAARRPVGEMPENPAGAAPRPRRRPPAGPVPQTPSVGRTAGLNLPIVIATASIALAIGAGILLLRGRKPSVSPPAQRPPARVEPFRPPEEPPPRVFPAQQPRLDPAELSDEAEPQAPVKSAPNTSRKPDRKGPAKRW